VRTTPKSRRRWGLKRVFTEASITARPFFERRGFRVVREQIVMVRGVGMKNFVKEKDLLGQEQGATSE
jgi:putative acetyltransferase